MNMRKIRIFVNVAYNNLAAIENFAPVSREDQLYFIVFNVGGL